MNLKKAKRDDSKIDAFFNILDEYDKIILRALSRKDISTNHLNYNETYNELYTNGTSIFIPPLYKIYYRERLIDLLYDAFSYYSKRIKKYEESKKKYNIFLTVFNSCVNGFGSFYEENLINPFEVLNMVYESRFSYTDIEYFLV